LLWSSAIETKRAQGKTLSRKRSWGKENVTMETRVVQRKCYFRSEGSRTKTVAMEMMRIQREMLLWKREGYK
jgi:hypothetical protein